MNKSSIRHEISPEREKEMWRQHNIDSLLQWASLPFTTKIEMLEGMEEVARSFHGGKLPPSPDEHEEPASAEATARQAEGSPRDH